jgi:SNF2 family DNA or RNA helicase
MNGKLFASFNALSNNERQILLALAVIFVPTGQSALQDLLKKSAVFPPPTLAVIDKNLREKLLRNELIVISPDGWQCSTNAVELWMRLAVKEPWFTKLAAFLLATLPRQHYYQARISDAQLTKKLRLHLYLCDDKAFFSEINQTQAVSYQSFANILDHIFFQNFDEAWFAALSTQIKYFVLAYFVNSNLHYLSEFSLQYHLLEHSFGTEKPDNPAIRHTVIEQRLLRGNFNDAETWLQGEQSANGLKIAGTLRFLQNRYAEALELFNAALNALKKETGKRNISLDGLHGVFFSLALLQNRSFSNLSLLKQNAQITIKHGRNDELSFLFFMLLDAVEIYQGKQTAEHSDYLFKSSNYAYERLFQALLLYWVGEIDQRKSKSSDFLAGLAAFCLHAQQFGHVWYAAVSSTLLRRLEYASEACALIAQQYSQSPFISIIDLLPQVSKWQRALEALAQLNQAPVIAQVQQETRMIWTVYIMANQAWLEPKEQKLGKTGRWTKGRPVALKRLYESMAEFDYLSEQDRRICAYIKMEKERSYYGAAKDIFEMSAEAVLAAVGHPYVYWSDREATDAAIEITVAEPQLLVKEQKQNLHISILPTFSNQKIFAEKTAGNGLLIYKISDQHRQVAEILGTGGLTVPAAARRQVVDSIASIASMLTVQSDIGGTSSHAQTVATDSRLHMHLQPVGLGLQIEAFVQPFSEGGPLYKPGVGGATVLAEINGQQLQTNRDFKLEKRNLKQTLDECPLLYAEKDVKWLLDDPESALETLLQLQALSDFVLLEWPKGKKIQISPEAGLLQARISVRKEKDWFSVEGSLRIDEQQVLDMRQLMRLLSNSPGRFLKLDDGQIIALTRELRQRLDDLAGFGEVYKDQVRFHPLAAQTLDEITSGMHINAGKPWQEQLRRLNDMSNLNPRPPSTLQGELRDYQLEGYQWLSRLAHWGAGACLADDMGLGKTVQALALILSRAPDGPTLILAPTSVCINWLEESQRFAPTLNVKQFGSGDRQTMLDEAGPFDVIVCSYGLLQSESERLEQKHWQTLVADEAQAFKNALTKRSKAVMALQADFKMITTGTPIENHLGELWNLFNFINPGLLGTLSKFNERYAIPIENQQVADAPHRLRKLLQPFILRRLKNDVLSELPARTEVTLHIDLSTEERVIYEALRRDALQTMLDATGQASQQHLKVLAEIMKLRRACCHPRLVMAESPVASSKLEAFAGLVDELLENRHKALVFSQFVGHLTLIRELLDKKGIAYHYLDGSTPVTQRKSAMKSFQAGNGDLFLISLKAGGTGLNLTAADYVIHMDPWWNPAVEDQASDRAHRMGQKRPVTIYRLVAKDTIEDKIVALHKHKRDLANSLLEGGEVSGKMSVEDMLALIKDID